jgi:hypothetical protein
VVQRTKSFHHSIYFLIAQLRSYKSYQTVRIDFFWCFDKDYQLRLENFEDEIISHLRLLGAENNLNSITYHKVNTDWTQRFKHLLESEISNFVEQYDTDYGKLVETPKLLGFKKNPMSPYISIAIDLFGDRDGIRQNLWETLHRSLPISDMGIDYDV